MDNSLNTAEIATLCDDFLRLFEQNREHKQKVPCLIGPSNSGKTSLFMATAKIIDPSKVARVTKQRQFNKAMISESTELINLDEARVELMDVDDWKIITQGFNLLVLCLLVFVYLFDCFFFFFVFFFLQYLILIPLLHLLMTNKKKKSLIYTKLYTRE